MKNLITLFAAVLLSGFGGYATTAHKAPDTFVKFYFNYGESFTFVEDGVTFAVFQNGEFDFYINPRSGVHVGYNSRNVNISFNSGYNYDAYVQYDMYGAVIQVEHIPIYYDYYGRVSRIGSVNIYYDRGRLVRLGGLYVHYDHWGYYSHYSGYINRYNRHYVFHPYHNYFVRPFFEFRIVSYKPYRRYYAAKRYRYYRDHARNTYYGKYHKRYNRSTHDRPRVATTQVPKRRADRIARTDRYVDSKRYYATARNGRAVDRTSRSTNAVRTDRAVNTGNNRNGANVRNDRGTTRTNRGNSTVTRRAQSSNTGRAVNSAPEKRRAGETKSVTRRSAPAVKNTKRALAPRADNRSKTKARSAVTKTRTIKPKTIQRRGNATTTSKKPQKRESKKIEPRKSKRRG